MRLGLFPHGNLSSRQAAAAPGSSTREPASPSSGRAARGAVGDEAALVRRGRSLIAAACALVASTVCLPAQALPPDHWDMARSRDASRIERALDEAEEKLEQAGATRAIEVKRELAMEVRSSLEALLPVTSDPRVALYLGHTLSLLDDDARVIRVLAPAIEAAPNHPAALQGLFNLAVAYARSDRPHDEIHAYDMLLERQSAPGWRNTILSNRAEAKAKLGLLDAAIVDYRASIALSPGPDGVLARWGLAVTLDRAGDLSRALEEGGRAYDFDGGERSRLDERNVFFVPAYEKWWYHALRQMSGAKVAQRTDAKLLHYERAARLWELFLAQALSTDRWVPLARARLKLCEATVVKLRAQVAKEARATARRGGPVPPRQPE
jgi:tetratricopeptide (TPR) repeat protein